MCIRDSANPELLEKNYLYPHIKFLQKYFIESDTLSFCGIFTKVINEGGSISYGFDTLMYEVVGVSEISDAYISDKLARSGTSRFGENTLVCFVITQNDTVYVSENLRSLMPQKTTIESLSLINFCDLYKTGKNYWSTQQTKALIDAGREVDTTGTDSSFRVSVAMNVLAFYKNSINITDYSKKKIIIDNFKKIHNLQIEKYNDLIRDIDILTIRYEI